MAVSMRKFLIFSVMTSVIFAMKPHRFDHGVDVDSTRPLILAHRGFCGAYPEHTKMSYQKAIDEGADVIECDICLTKDLEMVCLHESRLSLTTDVENRTEFADRRKTETVYNVNITDWFSTDFTLNELRTLRKKQRFSFRDPSFDGQLIIPTLDEYIDVAESANRTVGIYPEVKDPAWVNGLSIVKFSGKTFEDMVIEKLNARGYNKPTHPCFLQCFDESSVIYMAPKTELPLIQLLGSEANVSDPKLKEYAKLVYGLGVSKTLIVNHYTPANGEKNYISETTDLVSRAHAAGLKVHAWTMRNEDRYLAWDYKQDGWYEYQRFYELEVDGLFTDFTPSMKRFLDWQYETTGDPISAGGRSVSPLTSQHSPATVFYIFLIFRGVYSGIV